MSPRPYRLGQRQAATDQTRTRIVEAARELLAAEAGVSGFSVDAVARQAGVARMTVYYQFGSKAGLLEALFDQLAMRGGMERMAEVFQEQDPLAALAKCVAVFTRVWASERLVTRRLRGLAVLDPEIERGLRARDMRRPEIFRALLRRLAERYGRPPPEALDDAADLMATLTGFHTFDSLAGEGRSADDVARLLSAAARAILGFDGQPSGGVAGPAQGGQPQA